jgi:hypothetical protein
MDITLGPKINPSLTIGYSNEDVSFLSEDFKDLVG